ncbi:hypothetical protein C5167_011304 [Papaver somniferum]|uniref:Uncharacterized protein n=1 Tax=Papaver somniferum TaxID=3469 RepID=A0A4Y7K6L4_PAPSO|nr:hypothetical protein C5167_011304 [Papaver somniferum]
MGYFQKTIEYTDGSAQQLAGKVQTENSADQC